MNSDGLSSPEQFGVWEVDGVGLCVAFRGTASTEDVLIDVNITPTPLETSRNMRGATPEMTDCTLSTTICVPWHLESSTPYAWFDRRAETSAFVALRSLCS